VTLPSRGVWNPREGALLAAERRSMRKDLPPITRIVLFTLRQNVVGGLAAQLAEALNALDLDSSAILDLSAVTSIDGYGINVIAETLSRGVSVYLVGVRGRVRRMFRQAGSVSPTQFVESVPAALQAIECEHEPAPKRIVERRAYPRVRSHIPAEIVIDLDGRRVATEGIIKDISEGGVYVEFLQKLSEAAGEDLDLNASIDMRMTLPDVSYPCLVQGSTVHRGAAAVGACYGVRFSEVTYLDEDAIRVFLYNHDPDRRAGSA